MKRVLLVLGLMLQLGCKAVPGSGVHLSGDFSATPLWNAVVLTINCSANPDPLCLGAVGEWLRIRLSSGRTEGPFLSVGDLNQVYPVSQDDLHELRAYLDPIVGDPTHGDSPVSSGSRDYANPAFIQNRQNLVLELDGESNYPLFQPAYRDLAPNVQKVHEVVRRLAGRHVGI